VSDIDTAAVESLKALDPKWPIREADIRPPLPTYQFGLRAVGEVADRAAFRLPSRFRNMALHLARKPYD
jgi:hypothetical protein